MRIGPEVDEQKCEQLNFPRPAFLGQRLKKRGSFNFFFYMYYYYLFIYLFVWNKKKITTPTSKLANRKWKQDVKKINDNKSAGKKYKNRW